MNMNSCDVSHVKHGFVWRDYWGWLLSICIASALVVLCEVLHEFY